MPDIATTEKAKALLGQAEQIQPSTIENQAAIRLQELTRDKSAREALENFVTEPVDMDRLRIAREKAISADWDNKIGSEKIDKSGNKIRTGEQKNLSDSFDSITARVNLVLEKGWGGLNETEREQVRPDIEKALRRNSVVADVLDQASNKDEIIDQIAKNKNFALHLRELFGKSFSEDSLPESISQDVIDKMREAKNRLQKEEERLSLKKKDRDRRQDEFRKRWEEAGGLEGETLGQLNKQPLETDRIGFQTDVSNLESKLAGMRKTADSDSERQSLIDQINSAKENLRKCEDSIRRRDELRVQKGQDQEGINSVEDAISVIELEVGERRRDALATQADFQIADNIRKAGERGYVESLNRVISEAAAETIKDVVSQSSVLETQAMQEVLEKTQDKALKQLRKDLIERYYKIERKSFLGIRKRPEKIYNKSNIDHDWAILIDPKKGIEGVITARLLQMPEYRDNEDPTVLNEEGQKVLRNSEVRDVKEEYAEKLLSNKVQTSKITRAEAEILDQNPELRDSLIEAALNKNPDTKELVNKLKEAGIMQGGPLEFFRGQPRWRQVLLAVLTLGGLAAAIKVGAPVAAGVAASHI